MLQSSSPLGLGYLGPEDGCAQALLLVPHGTKHRRRRFGSAAIRKSTGKENGKSDSFSSLALCLVGASHVPKRCPLGRQRGDKPQICSTQTLIVPEDAKHMGYMVPIAPVPPSSSPRQHRPGRCMPGRSCSANRTEQFWFLQQ